MSFTRLHRSTAAALGSLVLAGGAVGIMAATSAHAETIGTLKVTPATGSDTVGMAFDTSGPCPAAAANVILKVQGEGFPAEGQNVVGNSEIAIYQPAPGGGFSVPLMQTMRDYAKDAGFKELKGRYDFTRTCRNAFGADTYGDFTTAIWFTTNTTYQDTDPAGGTPTPTPTPSTTPTNTTTPTDSPTPTTDPTDTGEPTDTDEPTDTTGGDTSGDTGDDTTGGDSQDISTEVDGGASGGDDDSLAATGADAGWLAAVAAALVGSGTIAVRQARRRGLLSFTDSSND